MGMFDWDGGSVVSSSSRQHKRRKASGGGTSSKHSGDRSRSRSRSRHRKASGGGGLENFLTGGSHYKKHNSSRSSGLGGLGEGSNYRKHGSSRGSFFGLGGNASSRSFFGLGRATNSSSSSFYKRSPRSNFLAKAYRKLRRLLRDLVYWAKRHPVKVFLLVVMPLITGGALTALLARFGLRLPPAVERMLGIAARTAGGGGSAGLVTEAVRMVSGGGGSSGHSTVSVERGRDGGMRWERRREDGYFGGSGGGYGGYSSRSSDYDYSRRGGGSSRGEGGGFMGSVSRFFS